MNPLLLIDGYKADHRRQYPDGTTLVYSNFTPRKSRVPGVDSVVFFGLQYFIIEYLQHRFQKDFFDRPKDEVVEEYKREMDAYLGPDAVPVDHIAALHDLGYLPIRICAVPEGVLVPVKVPMLTIYNTLPEFFWLTNQLETLLSSCLWLPCTSATTAFHYRQSFDKAAEETGYDPGFVRFQGHDFSFRGMSSPESSQLSGAGHLLSFMGTDTVPAIHFLRKYYGAADAVGCSVPATEHSVMCMGTKDAEIATYRRLISETYPKGVVSIVSDTWDFWSIMTTGLKALKEDILNRDGCVVFRPDSGDPVKIVCGDPDAPEGTPERLGAFELLWNEFGGTVSSKGYRLLDSHVGLIYGDSITRERQEQIIKGLMTKVFAPTVVLGIGSYTYQYVTRDTFGFAMKATYGEVDGVGREIFKDPKTDSGGEKRSAKGLLRVVGKDANSLELRDQQTWEAASRGWLNPVFEDGVLLCTHTLSEIRNRLHRGGF